MSRHGQQPEVRIQKVLVANPTSGEGMNAAAVIAALGLAPLPGEGGFYRETYRARNLAGLGRSASTAIYYLLTPDSFSALHVLRLDEIYHFYRGDPVDLTLLH